MQSQACNIESKDVQKLLSTASGDAALLYLYLKSGNDFSNAEEALHMNQSRIQCAGATLRQLGLWQEEKQATVIPGERPKYTEDDVNVALRGDKDFHALYLEMEQQLGRSLTTEELKILLGFVRYLGLPVDVIFVLVCYCRDRARQRGSVRNPSLRAIEKEAYAWADQGINTIAEAGAYIQNQNFRNGRIREMMDIFQIRNRNLTQTEERYAQQWLDMGFAMDAISMAYERTCLNTGGMNWAYMHKILTRWNQAGFTNAQQIKEKDTRLVPKGANGQLGQAEMDAIRRLKED